MKIERIDCESMEFPEKLKNIPHPPKQIYVMGNAELLHQKSIAVVGSRKYTVYGKNVAMLVGNKLSVSGIPVVSGLAYGIDAYAHEGTVAANGKGIAVLGSGINKMTPYPNKPLMNKILDKGGLIVSEYEPNFQAQKWTYPERNRIISGLSEGVIVIEANYNSGALITAQCANEQGRTVYAVPGNINSQFSMGSNLLIRDGAVPLIIIDDVIRDIGRFIPIEDVIKVALDEDEIEILEVVKMFNGVSSDKLASILGKSVGHINSIVTILEIKGIVETYSGKIHLATEYNSC